MMIFYCKMRAAVSPTMVILKFIRALLPQSRYELVELNLVLHHYLAGLAALCRSHHASLFQLVHQSSSAVVTNGELALDEGGGTLLVNDDEMCRVVEERIELLEVHVSGTRCSLVVNLHLWKLIRAGVTLLFG